MCYAYPEKISPSQRVGAGDEVTVMNKMIRQINRDIFEALSARKLLGSVPSRRAAQELMKETGWNERLDALFPIKERLSCLQVLELCRPILDRICPQEPEKGWGPFCYQYICRMMFPDGGFAPEADRCGGGARPHAGLSIPHRGGVSELRQGQGVPPLFGRLAGGIPL